MSVQAKARTLLCCIGLLAAAAVACPRQALAQNYNALAPALGAFFGAIQQLEQSNSDDSDSDDSDSGGADSAVNPFDLIQSMPRVERKRPAPAQQYSAPQQRSLSSSSTQSRSGGPAGAAMQQPRQPGNRFAQSSAAPSRGSGGGGLIAERHDCGRPGNPPCAEAGQRQRADALQRNPAAERQAAVRAEADRVRRQELKRQQDNSSRAVVRSQSTCTNRFGPTPATNGQYVCGNAGEIHACRCTGSSCQLIPTRSFLCTKVGAIIR